jgi:hypothetical protein
VRILTIFDLFEVLRLTAKRVDESNPIIIVESPPQLLEVDF